METRSKTRFGQPRKPALLNLGDLGIYPDLRKLVYSKLTELDLECALIAHIPGRARYFDAEFYAKECARNGYFPLLKYILKDAHEIDPDIGWTATKKGHLDMLKWLYSRGCPINKYNCADAACYGHLHILKWLRRQKCPWDEETCDWSALYGHLETLQWALDNGCPQGEGTGSYAVQGGHLPVIQLLHDNGRVFEWFDWLWASDRGQLHVLKWAVTHGYQFDNVEECIARANNHPETVAYLESLRADA
jgi:hypothetical protein